MHLVEYLDELGEASWLELQAYQSLTGIEIPPGECRIIIKIGQEQESMASKALKKDCPAPYEREIKAEQSAQIVSNFFAPFKTK